MEASGNSLSSRYLHLGENILHCCLLRHEITVHYLHLSKILSAVRARIPLDSESN